MNWTIITVFLGLVLSTYLLAKITTALDCNPFDLDKELLDQKRKENTNKKHLKSSSKYVGVSRHRSKWMAL